MNKEFLNKAVDGNFQKSMKVLFKKTFAILFSTFITTLQIHILINWHI